MKKLNYIYILLVSVFMTILSGCQDFLDVNVDPTLKADATVQELLPTAQLYTSEASYQQAYTAAQYAQQLGSNLGTNGSDAYYESENATGWSFVSVCDSSIEYYYSERANRDDSFICRYC